MIGIQKLYKMKENKTNKVLVRLSDTEKEGFSIAADLAGIPLATWMRERLRLASIRELESAGILAPFIDPKRQGPSL